MYVRNNINSISTVNGYSDVMNNILWLYNQYDCSYNN